MIKRFDLVILKSVQNVKWLSGPPSRPTSPKGVWSVVSGVGGRKMLFLAKENTMIQVPVLDVTKVGDYNLNQAIGMVKRVRSLDEFEREVGDGKVRG